ncbi:Zn(2)-C6 fungal-type domain-containing protein [Mycena kentingensis (nom. inval.)]|nr:Zn(2)-C6 fungal-type domain-containing protein [Mycena kentingensis (nom. inval.)]
MSNAYTAQSWAQFSNPPRLQLEHEYDYNTQQSYSDSYPFSSDFQQSQFPTQSPSSSFSRNHSPARSVDHSAYPGSFQFGPQNTNFLSAEQREYHNNATTYNFQTATSPTPLTASGLSAITTSPQSLNAPQLPRPFYPQHAPQQPKTKRARGPTVPAEDGKEEEIEPELDDEGGARAKPPGACARCKNLKVKCEFKTDTDPCKRCFNGGHECVTPGRKKRRTPPKREHLLNQIREQAAEIAKLMSQLEETNARRGRPPNSTTTETFPHSPSSGLHSPVLSEAAAIQISPETTKHVEDWLAKARDSLAEFDGFIGIGGAGMPQRLLVKEDLEDPSSDGDDLVSSDDPNSGEYEIEVLDSDGEEVPRTRRGAKMRQMSTASGGSDARVPKKKDSGGEKLATLPSEASPFGLMADLSLKKSRAESPEPDEMDAEATEPALGIASDAFFRSSPAPDPLRTRPVNDHPALPHILTRGLITPQEAEKLFDIYFQRMNLSVSLLDPVLYTAQKTCYRSPFLFTVVCAIASRFYTERPDLYPQATHYAQLAAGTALISGQKCVESVQAYILMSLYPVPAKRWEDERGWLYLGLAIRLAIDLNLHLPNTAQPINESHAREMLNRTRVWLNCFNLDRSTGSQYGKTPTISNSDYMANHSEEWWRLSPYNMRNFDIHICAYNAELKVMAAFMAKIYSDPSHPTGLNKTIDFEKIASDTDEELKKLGDYWQQLIVENTDQSDTQNIFRSGLLKLAYSYARLVALSFGFQHAFSKNNPDENPFLMRCLTASEDVVAAVVATFGKPEQRVYLRYGPIAQTVFVTFGASMIVKLLQPKFSSYITPDKRQEMRGLVKSVIDLLSSPDVSIDAKHGPHLYARFLKGLLAAPQAKSERKTPGRANSTHSTGSSSHLAADGEREGTPSSASQTSPEGGSHHSLSPPATSAALSFDRFAPPLGRADPFLSLSATTAGNSLGLGGADAQPDFVFPPNLNFHEQMQGIQSWPETDYSWMNQNQEYVYNQSY